jgi:signal transduction histidine kinase
MYTYYKRKLLVLKFTEEENISLQNSLLKELKHREVFQNEMIEQDRLATIGSMVAGISHEVNNPLGVTLTTLGLSEKKCNEIRSKYESEKLTKHDLKEYLDYEIESLPIIRKNLEQATNTINGFRMMSMNVEALDTEPVHLKAKIEEIISMMRFELRKKQVEIELIFPSEILFQCNPGHINQIFSNLILNSLRHGFVLDEEHKITIKGDVINQHIVLSFVDNGVGIPDDNLDRIFNLFFTTTKDQGGSGVGLHVIKNIIEKELKGHVSCFSKAGETSFEITIPKST